MKMKTIHQIFVLKRDVGYQVVRAVIHLELGVAMRKTEFARVRKVFFNGWNGGNVKVGWEGQPIKMSLLVM